MSDRHEVAPRHGHADYPKTRGLYCREQRLGCGAIENDVWSVEGAKGFPARGPEDGWLGSGGRKNAQFDPVNEPTAPGGRPWPVTAMPSGGLVVLTWQITAKHPVGQVRYFVTRDGWNQRHRLARSDLDLEPWFVARWDLKQWHNWPNHDRMAFYAVLPDKLGRHILYAVWDVDDTENAFYGLCDVEFTRDATTTPEREPIDDYTHA